MRDDLEERLARPGRPGVGVQVVEDQQRRLAHLGQQLVVPQLGVVAVRRAQPVEQVGDRQEERGPPALDGAHRAAVIVFRLFAGPFTRS